MTTNQPSNPSELQLYRVLLRANLLQYYDTFVAQGGDDVQQLCEAGEEEFLEIMALVGMASKPLHVRRLQKALQEWVANPASFQGTTVREPPTHVYSLPTSSTADSSPSSPWNAQNTPLKSSSPVNNAASGSSDIQSEASTVMNKKLSISPGQSPILLEEQINDLAVCAAKLAKSLPVFEAKPLNLKKDVNKQITEILATPSDFTKERLELMRKYGSIYRRFDSERTYQKPMSMHEVCVNEAAAQLCFHMPSLLTRREDLFPLARQVVKDSGYQYSKGHSRATELNPENPSKRQKLELMLSEYKGDSSLGKGAGERNKREERLKEISKELASVSEKQEQIVNELDAAKESGDEEKIDLLQSLLEQITNQHLQLLTEQSDLLRKQSYDVYTDAGDTGSDREDSNLGHSGSSSPSQNDKLELAQQHKALKAMLTTGQIPKSSLAILSKISKHSNNTLFDEGLRIAQQYGLGDFAQELKSLQGGGNDEDDSEHLPTRHVRNFCSSVQNNGLNDKGSGSNGVGNGEGSDNEPDTKTITDGKRQLPMDWTVKKEKA